MDFFVLPFFHMSKLCLIFTPSETIVVKIGDKNRIEKQT